MTYLVTGAAGFIGYHTCLQLMRRGEKVVGIDNINDYYDTSLKFGRLEQLAQSEHSANFEFRRLDLIDREGVAALFSEFKFNKVVNLAAQAGVRYASINPHAYIDSNIVGFMNILEGCRHNDVKHLVYASSSSVYGANESLPFSEHDNVDHPLSLYAATKKANELMAHTYSNLYNLATTGLRFFTVYGPWGRPDMALFLFARSILAGEPIDVFNFGNHKRDFTFVDDIVEGVIRVLDHNAQPDLNWSGKSPDPASSSAPWRVYNIGNNAPVNLMDYIETLERRLGKTAVKNFKPLQPGDVPDTYANVKSLVDDMDYRPSTTIEEGIGKFVDWYQDYYGVTV